MPGEAAVRDRRAANDFRTCPACGQVHDILQVCAKDSQLRVWDDVELCERPDPEWDISGVTQQGSLEVLYGPSDAGKSTLIAGRACCLATGAEWLGATVRRRGAVVVLVFEGLHAFKKKLRAWKAIHGYDSGDRIGVYVIEDHINFRDRADVSGLVRIIEDRNAIELVVDTLAQSICGDEDNEQMQLAVTNAAMLRRATGVRVVFIHHSGKNRQRGARGGSALTAAADTVLALDPHNGGGHVLQCVRQRDGVRFAPMFLKLTPTEDGSAALFERLTEGPTVSALPDGIRARARLKQEVLAYVHENPGANTTAIAKGHRRKDVIDVLSELERDGQVRHDERGMSKEWRTP